MSLNDWIKLSVGGRPYETTRRTLVACPDSLLANMFSLESSRPADAVSPDEVFKVDADPDVFGILLNWLRYKKLMMTDGISLESVAVVAEAFGLIDLKDAVEEHKKLTQTETVRFLGTNDNTQKSITEELEEVLNFLKGVQIASYEDLNVMKKPLDHLQSTLKYIPLGQHFNILPAEIKTNILSYLFKLDALTAASVCQEWEGMLKISWGIRKIRYLGGMDLKDVDPGVLARAENEVESVTFSSNTKLTYEQITGFFAHLAMQNTKLKKLDFYDHDLSPVNTDHLAIAVNKLETVRLSCASLSDQQLNAILRHIVDEDTKLKKLWLNGIDLSGVEEDLLTRAKNKLSQLGGIIVMFLKNNL